MAKDLPYFKFFCSEWNDGDITLEDYNIQGVFINVCSYYWSKECNLESKLLYKRFKEVKTEIDLLVSENHIKIKSGYVVISFLDEQKEDREASRAIKVKGGKASAEARKLKGQQLYVIECYNTNERFIKVGVTKDSVSRRYSGSDNKTMPYKYNILGQYLYAKGNIYPTELETIIESRITKYIPKINFKGYTECYNLDKADQIDEILKESTGKGLSSTGIQQELNSSSTQVQVLREEKIRKDNKIDNSNYLNTILKDQYYLETTCMQTKHNLDTVIKYLKDFELHLVRTSEQKPNIKEFKTHFTNWFNLQNVQKIVKHKKIDYGNPNG